MKLRGPGPARRWSTPVLSIGLPAALLAAVSITANAFDVDDVERFNYVNNVPDPSPWVWGPGYWDLLPSLTAYALHPLPLPAQAILYRVAALLAAVILFHELRRLVEGWRTAAAAPALIAGAMIGALHLVEPALLANLSWVNWSVLLAAVTRLVATAHDEALPQAAAIGVTIALLTTPAGVLAVPLLLAGGRTTGLPGRGRAIAAVTVVAWHALQACFWPGEWTPRPPLVVAAIVDQFSDGVWHYNIVLGGAAVAIVSVALGVAWRSRTRVLETAMLCYMAWASLAAFVFSSRLVDQGFEPRYILTPAFCAMVAGLDLGLRARAARSVMNGFVAMIVTLTILNVHVDRRGPVQLWLQKMQFTADAAAFRRACAPDAAVSFEDEPASIVIECRPRARPPGEHPVVGARPAMGVYQPHAPLSDRPSVTVPLRMF